MQRNRHLNATRNQFNTAGLLVRLIRFYSHQCLVGLSGFKGKGEVWAQEMLVNGRRLPWHIGQMAGKSCTHSRSPPGDHLPLGFPPCTSGTTPSVCRDVSDVQNIKGRGPVRLFQPIGKFGDTREWTSRCPPLCVAAETLPGTRGGLPGSRYAEVCACTHVSP